MTCQEFWDRMPELSSQLLNDEAGHLEACRECSSTWQRQRQLNAGIRDLSHEWRRVQAPPRVEAGLVAAFRAHQARRPIELPVRNVWMPMVSGIAAALLVAVGLLLLRDRPVQPIHRTTASVELAALSAPADSVTDDDSPDSDGFIPLPNAQRIGPDENVNVVRVEVPRSAMLAVGLPVSADQSLELVEADIKMGSDGLARAVRFVNE
jgi:hypothetical protein